MVVSSSKNNAFRASRSIVWGPVVPAAPRTQSGAERNGHAAGAELAAGAGWALKRKQQMERAARIKAERAAVVGQR